MDVVLASPLNRTGNVDFRFILPNCLWNTVPTPWHEGFFAKFEPDRDWDINIHAFLCIITVYSAFFLSSELATSAPISFKALANEHCIVADTLLQTQMLPRLSARTTFVADTNFVSGTQIMFLILFRNIFCPQQMFPSLRSPRNIMGNNVSATMCPRLPGPLVCC